MRPYLALPTAVHVLCVGSFVNRAGSFAMVFLTIYVSKELGFGVTFAANCFGIFGVGSIISSLLGGQLADRLGRKPVMVFALIGAAASLVALSFAKDRYSFLLMVLVFSLTIEMYRPAASAMMGDLVDHTQRPLAFGLMYIAFNLGFAVAAPVGGFLAHYSYQWLFWGDAITTASYGLIIAFLIRDTLPNTAKAQSAVGGWARTLSHIANDHVFMLFSLATLMTSIVFMQAFTTLPIHLDKSGYSEENIGWLLSTNGILIVFCQIPITHFLNRFNRLSIIVVGELLIATGFGLTTFAATTAMFLLTIMIWTLGEVVQAAFKQSLVADMAPADMRGRYMGVFSFCHAAGIAFGAPLGGQVLDRWGPNVLWPSCFCIVAISAAIYGFLYSAVVRRKRLERAVAEG
ncbi:MDR family MFS transporter [Planctomycetota bacterium]